MKITMDFYLDDTCISFEQFSQLYPEESKILASFRSNNTSLRIKNGRFEIAYGNVKGIKIDIETQLAYHQKFFSKTSPYKQPLARALGLKRETVQSLHVLDATAGLLGDSLLIQALGVKQHTVCERHPLLFALIRNALSHHPLPVSCFFMSALDLKQSFDVIFFDPMYQQVNKKTAPKKEMVFMREIVGADPDAKETASLLRDKCKRLVIKRSSKTAHLLEGVHHTVQGKSTCYDIYLNI